jgi:hypothetical protein
MSENDCKSTMSWHWWLTPIILVTQEAEITHTKKQHEYMNTGSGVYKDFNE